MSKAMVTRANLVVCYETREWFQMLMGVRNEPHETVEFYRQRGKNPEDYEIPETYFDLLWSLVHDPVLDAVLNAIEEANKGNRAWLDDLLLHEPYAELVYQLLGYSV